MPEKQLAFGRQLFASLSALFLSLSLFFLSFFFSLLPPFYTQENLSCFSYNSLGVLRGVVFVISCGSCLTTCRVWGGILAGVVSLPRFPLELLCSGCPTEFPRADCVVLSPRKVKYKCRVGGWKQNDMEKRGGFPSPRSQPPSSLFLTCA